MNKVPYIYAVLFSLVGISAAANSSTDSPENLSIQSVSDSSFELCVNGVKVKSHHLKPDDIQDKMFGTGSVISSVIDEKGNAAACITDSNEADLNKYGIVSVKNLCIDGSQFLYLEVRQRTRVKLPKVIVPKSKTCTN